MRSSDMMVNGRILDAVPEAELMQFFTGEAVPDAVARPRDVPGLFRRNTGAERGRRQRR
jgi:hypothetical protein